MSDWFNVDAGIPQGTVLGPILWLLWVNDCPVDNLDILSRETDRGCLFVGDPFLFASLGTKGFFWQAFVYALFHNTFIQYLCCCLLYRYIEFHGV